MTHHCHALHCANACPPKHLMCATCWATVSPATQAEVYRTVKLRDMSGCDHTWAPWWRASHTAIAEAARARGLDGHAREGMTDGEGKPLPPWSVDRWLAGQMKIADDMERER
jgi:hypothetical protein